MVAPLLAGAAGLGKVAWTSIKGMSMLEKLMAMFMLPQMGGDILESLGRTSIGKAGMNVAQSQAEGQVAIGRRKEARADKLIQQLLSEKMKQTAREDAREGRQESRALSGRRQDMSMAMLMSLMESQRNQRDILSTQKPSTMSMLNLMR